MDVRWYAAFHAPEAERTTTRRGWQTTEGATSTHICTSSSVIFSNTGMSEGKKSIPFFARTTTSGFPDVTTGS